jgi:hypothetical protein
MRKDESYVYDILQECSHGGDWKFFECFDEKGEPVAQAKNYPNTNHWVAYPDFEYYNQNKLTLLVECKGYCGYFGNTEYAVAMKYRHFKNYIEVGTKEKVEVRICFALLFDGKYDVYWETLGKIARFPRKISKYTQNEYNRKTGKVESVTEDYIYWYTTYFREDYWNLPLV